MRGFEGFSNLCSPAVVHFYFIPYNKQLNKLHSEQSYNYTSAGQIHILEMLLNPHCRSKCFLSKWCIVSSCPGFTFTVICHFLRTILVMHQTTTPKFMTDQNFIWLPVAAPWMTNHEADVWLDYKKSRNNISVPVMTTLDILTRSRIKTTSRRLVRSDL